MKPITFKEVNVTFAKDQPEYLPLPAWKGKDGQVTSCWKLTWRERFKMMVTGKIWLSILTFNAPLQPQKVDVNKPV